ALPGCATPRWSRLRFRRRGRAGPVPRAGRKGQSTARGARTSTGTEPLPRPYNGRMDAPVDELLDVLDDNGNPTGERKPRSAVHRDGDWHRAFHLWVVREGHLVILQRRAEEKDLEPLRLDVTVGGHYRAGEMFVDVLREAEEEIGLVLRPGQVAFLGTVRSERHYPDPDPPRVDREFQEIYATHDDRPLSAYVQEPEEVDTLYEVPL